MILWNDRIKSKVWGLHLVCNKIKNYYSRKAWPKLTRAGTHHALRYWKVSKSISSGRSYVNISPDCACITPKVIKSSWPIFLDSGDVKKAASAIRYNSSGANPRSDAKLVMVNWVLSSLTVTFPMVIYGGIATKVPVNTSLVCSSSAGVSSSVEVSSSVGGVSSLGSVVFSVSTVFSVTSESSSEHEIIDRPISKAINACNL